MTPQEAQMLQDLVRKVESTQLTEKDPDAEALLYDGLARDPDALYKLAQTVLVQSLALDQARGQIEQLRQQPVPTQQPARATSFLGGLFGHREQTPPPQQPPQYQYQQVPQYQAAPQYAPGPGYGPVEYAPAPSGAGSFLRSAATTAAGVAAGALAFEGIESLMHGGFGRGPEFGGGGYGQGFGGGGGYGAPEETVINNYYGDSNAQSGERYEGGSNGPDMQPQGPYEDDSNGPDMQPQGPYEEASDDSNFDDSSFGDDNNLV